MLKMVASRIMRKLVCSPKWNEVNQQRVVADDRIQMLHIHELLISPLGSGNMMQSCADEHQGGAAIRKSSHHADARLFFWCWFAKKIRERTF